MEAKSIYDLAEKPWQVLGSTLSVPWLEFWKAKLIVFGKSLECMTLARLAQSVEHETLNLRVVGSSPTLGGYCLVLPIGWSFAYF